MAVRKGSQLPWPEDTSTEVRGALYLREHCLLYLHRQHTNRTSKSQFPQRLRKFGSATNLTLEPGDFSTRNIEVDRIGQTPTCSNFETAWDYNTNSWLIS